MGLFFRQRQPFCHSRTSGNPEYLASRIVPGALMEHVGDFVLQKSNRCVYIKAHGSKRKIKPT
jgi:hypothetical protein